MNNLMETFSCEIWQTLPIFLVEKILPRTIGVLHPGVHLNLGPPLRQKYNTDSNDKSNIEAAAELVECTRELSQSMDPVICAYFADKIMLLSRWRKLDVLNLGLFSCKVTVKLLLKIADEHHW